MNRQQTPNRHHVHCLLLPLGLLLALAAAVVPAAEPPLQAVPQAVIRLPLCTTPAVTDGVLAPGEYDDAVVLGGDFTRYASPVSPYPNSPVVYLKRDRERLYIAYDNPLGPGERPKMGGCLPDNPGVCADNAVELYLMPRVKTGALLSFIQFAANARGVVYDTWVTPQIGISDVAGFSIDWRVRSTLTPGHWTTELAPRFADLRIGDTRQGEYFDADFCRDGGFGTSGASGYAAVFSGVQTGTGVRVVFDEKAPIVQWLSFGAFDQNLFNPKLRLRASGTAGSYTVTARVTDATPDAVTLVCKELYAESETLRLAKGGTAEFAPEFALPPQSKGIASYRIVDEKGTVVFFRQLPFTTGNPAIAYAKLESKPLVVKAEMAPSYGRILAAADIIDLPGDKAAVQVEASVWCAGQAEPLATATISKFPFDYGQAILQVSPGTLPAGAYEVRFKAGHRSTGQPLVPEERITLVRTVYEWENNSIGVTDKAFHPWTPMTVTGDKAFCWGREYTFTGLGLPASVLTLQPEPSRGASIADVLAAPVAVVAERAGKALTWHEGTNSVKLVNEVQVDVAGSAAADGLKAEVAGTLELDGFYKLRLKLTPTAPLPLDSLRVEVPLPTAAARLFNHSGEGMRTNKTFADFADCGNGVLWDSKRAAHNALVKGNFVPTTWIGDEDRGIAWMCDSDRGWVTTFDKPCLDVVRKGRTTTFRMHLLNKPGVLAKPIEVTFSLQATPVRPRPKGGSWKKEGWYGWSQFDKPLIWDKCFDEYAAGKGYKWYLTEEAKKTDRWWRYFCFNSDRIAASDPTYGQIVKDFGAEWYVDAPLAFVQNKLHTDFILWAYKQWHDKAGLKGSYHDNTFAVAWPGLINDSGWVDDDGNLRAGYGVMAYREFAKRERAYWLSVGPPPVIKNHTTDAPIVGYLGFADFWMDGENGGYPDLAVPDPDFVDRWYNRTGMANLRISLGRQWGVMPQYLYTWKPDPTQAVLGLFDIDHTYWRMNKVTADFGRAEADCDYIPYWDVRHLTRVTKGGPDVLTATWRRPGRVRVQVSNLSAEDRRVNVTLDLAGLGLPATIVATDEQSGLQADVRGDTIKGLPISRHSYRVLLLAAPGTFPAASAATPPAAAGARLKRLCRTFETVGKDWQPKGSGTWDTWCNTLRLNGKDGSIIALPFVEEKASVQVRIQASGCFWDAGPSLLLSWGKDRYVQLLAGNMCPMPNGPKVQAVAVNGGKPVVPLAIGTEAGVATWVRITLQADTILFLYSSDGQAWTTLQTVPRTGFEGAPERLILGLPSAGANEFHTGTGRGSGMAFFADLATTRE